LPLTLSVGEYQAPVQGIIHSSEGQEDKKENNDTLALLLVLG